MVRWNGFAELAFTESAWIAFARAVELAETDAHETHPEAWVIRDRRITFSVEAESGRAVVEGMKRFLGLLALQAESGEAVIETAPPSERWVRRADTSFGSHDLLIDPEDEAPHSRTIRVGSA
ncbi:hypothetical protein A7982_12136 [Minicystis rosea]|nr:hypothetical protein A7982_12136 [Minicystis rosea]